MSRSNKSGRVGETVQFNSISSSEISASASKEVGEEMALNLGFFAIEEAIVKNNSHTINIFVRK